MHSSIVPLQSLHSYLKAMETIITKKTSNLPWNKQSSLWSPAWLSKSQDDWWSSRLGRPRLVLFYRILSWEQSDLSPYLKDLWSRFAQGDLPKLPMFGLHRILIKSIGTLLCDSSLEIKGFFFFLWSMSGKPEGLPTQTHCKFYCIIDDIYPKYHHSS